MASLVRWILCKERFPTRRAPLSFPLLHFRVRLRFAAECDGGGDDDASEILVTIVLVKVPVGAGSVIDCMKLVSGEIWPQI